MPSKPTRRSLRADQRVHVTWDAVSSRTNLAYASKARLCGLGCRRLRAASLRPNANRAFCMKHERDNAAEACGAGEEVLLKHAERRGVVEVCGGVGVLPRRAEEEGGVPPRRVATIAVREESLSARSGSVAVRMRSSVCAVQARHRCFPANAYNLFTIYNMNNKITKITGNTI